MSAAGDGGPEAPAEKPPAPPAEKAPAAAKPRGRERSASRSVSSRSSSSRSSSRSRGRSRSRQRDDRDGDRGRRRWDDSRERRRDDSRGRDRDRGRRRRSPSSSSSDSEYLSDEDEQSPGARDWMRQHGRDPRIAPARIAASTLLEACVQCQRLSVKGKYGNWDDYLRFLHRFSRRCRPPPGREPAAQTPFVQRNFLQTLHVKDRSHAIERLLKAPLPLTF